MPSTADNLEEFAKSLETYATEYRRLAGLLREYGIGEMQIGIFKTGKDGMANLASFGASAMKGYLEAVNKKGLGWENPDPLSPKAQKALEEQAEEEAKRKGRVKK